MPKKVPLDEVMEDEDPAVALRELIRRIESGEVVQGAFRVRFTDGTHQDVAFGAENEEDLERSLAILQSQFETKH